MFNKKVDQRWASARCRSEMELSNTIRNSALRDPESQERLNFSDVKGQVNRRRSLFSDCNNPGSTRRSSSSTTRRSSLKEDLKRFWASRPSLVFIKPPTRIGNDNGLDSKERKKGAEDNETSDEETSTINSDDAEMMPAFFLVDRSLLKQPLKSDKSFPFFRK